MRLSSSAKVRGTALAVLAAALGALLFLMGSGAEAVGPLDPTGVYCIDGYVDGDQDTPKGNAPNDDPNPGNNDDQRSVKYLVRIEDSAGNPGMWDVTVVAYQGPGGPPPTKPPTADPCSSKGDGNSLNPSVTPQDTTGSSRPTALGQLVTKGPETNFEWEVCQANGFGDLDVLTRFSIVVTGAKDMDGEFGQQTAFLDANGCTTVGADIEFDLVLASTKRAGVAGVSDWDGGGRSDWDELAPYAGRDPFVPADDDVGVGGVAELPGQDVAAPLQAADESGGSLTAFLAFGSAGAAVLAAVGGAAYAARRRFIG